VALVLERLHPATMAAEGPLHELGAIQIVNSDSQGMGRIMETVRRTIQMADLMKAWRATDAGQAVIDAAERADVAGPLDPAGRRSSAPANDGPDDGDRVLRYLAKVTIEPAITHGIADHVGSLEPGRIADIVFWKPAYFGVKPELVLKGGHPAWSPLGEGNASVERAQPTRFAREFAGLPHAAPTVAVTFICGSTDARALRGRLDSGRAFVPVSRCRGLTRASLIWNRSAPGIDVDPKTGSVTLGGVAVAADPAVEVPLSRRYFLR
jgi:urease subunit alpha